MKIAVRAAVFYTAMPAVPPNLAGCGGGGGGDAGMVPPPPPAPPPAANSATPVLSSSTMTSPLSGAKGAVYTAAATGTAKPGSAAGNNARDVTVKASDGSKAESREIRVRLDAYGFASTMAGR